MKREHDLTVPDALLSHDQLRRRYAWKRRLASEAAIEAELRAKYRDEPPLPDPLSILSAAVRGEGR